MRMLRDMHTRFASMMAPSYVGVHILGVHMLLAKSLLGMMADNLAATEHESHSLQRKCTLLLMSVLFIPCTMVS
jgi:hypothetical protein